MAYDLRLIGKTFRLRIEATVWDSEHIGHQDAAVIVDTGNPNTIISENLAKRYGMRLVDDNTGKGTESTRLGSHIYKSELYMLPYISFENTFSISNIVVQAIKFDIQNELYDSILLGLNILNNWDYRIRRTKNIFSVEEDPPSFIPNKEDIYRNYFDLKTGEYILFQ